MKNPIIKLQNYIHRYGVKNLFSNDFLDKEATVNEFLSLYKGEVGNYESYEDLYKDALDKVGHISFSDKTKDYDSYFALLNKQDKQCAIVVGMLSYYLSKEIDSKGENIEKIIDKYITKLTRDANFDKNNPFDSKYGKGHRMFGHDPMAFGFNTIPSDYLIYVRNDKVPQTRKIIMVKDFLGIKEDRRVSMFEIIWKFYGDDSHIFKGILNCVMHIIAHFSKDLFTPDGLPIPLTSLLEKFKSVDNVRGNVLSYSESFYKSSHDAHLKASDFVSLGLIEVFTNIYCESLEEKDKLAGYKDDFKILAISTCFVLQLSKLIIAKSKKYKESSIDGAKINFPLLACYMNMIRKEAISIHHANKIINEFYRRRKHE